MARWFTHGGKAYFNNGSFLEELGDGINDGIGTGTVWIMDNERDSTFEIGDLVSGNEYIGKLSVPLASGGVIICPVFHNGNSANFYALESPLYPLDPDIKFPDVLDLNALDRTSFDALWGASPFSDKFTGVAEGETIHLDTGNDIFRAAGGNDIVYGDAGRDRIFGQRGADVIDGGEGDDRLFGGDGADQLRGEEGKDYMDGGRGKDELWGGDAADELLGGAGKDVLDGDKGHDTLRGGGGYDRLYGDEGNDILFGGAGDDYLSGGAGRDKLYGNAGRDSFSDDAGNDVMWGGAGGDSFTFFLDGDPHGHDRILDFDASEDRLNFFTDTPQELHFSHVSGNTIIDYDTGHLTLVDVLLTLESEAVFIY